MDMESPVEQAPEPPPAQETPEERQAKVQAILSSFLPPPPPQESPEEQEAQAQALQEQQQQERILRAQQEALAIQQRLAEPARICQEELARVRTELERVQAQRDALLLEIQQNSGRIRQGLSEIEQRDEQLNSLRTELERLTGQLREQSLVGQTNSGLMTEISELRPRIEGLETQIRELTSANEELSRDNATKQAAIDVNSQQIQRLLQEGVESAGKVQGQEEEIARLVQERENEQQRIQQLEQQKQQQLQDYSGQIQRLQESAQFQGDATTHTELLRRISIVNKLLHFYYLSRNVAGETPEGQALQQQISQAETRLRGLEDNLAAKGRECDQLLVKIQELEGTIRGLLQQVIGGIQGLPEGLGQLRTLNQQAQGIVQGLEEIRRTQSSKPQEEIRVQREQLSRELDRVSREISLLQGEIQGRFRGIETAIAAGNTEISTAMRTQSAAGIEAILAGQRATQVDIGGRISAQGQQLAQQTTQLGQLRGEFTTLQQQSQAHLLVSQRTHQMLDECVRGKHAAEQQVLASQGLAGRLQAQLATLEAQKVAAEQARQRADQQAQSLTTAVQAAAQAGVTAGQNAQRAQQAQAQAEDRLRREQQQGNPREIQRLQAALAQQEQRAQQAEQARQAALAEQQRASREQQAAQQQAQQAALQTAQAQGALQAAQAAQQSAEQTLQGAINDVAQRDMDTQAQRARELQQIQQQFEQQCIQREQEARQAAQQAAQQEILQLTAIAISAEQAQVAIQAAVDARIRAEVAQATGAVQAQAQQQAAQAAAQAARELATERALVAARDATIAVLEPQVQRIPGLEDQASQFLALQADCDNQRAIVQWHRSPRVTITSPVPAGGLIDGTEITFEVRNVLTRGAGARTVVYFYYADRTEYIDINDENPKTYTVRFGLQEVGAFNF